MWCDSLQPRESLMAIKVQIILDRADIVRAPTLKVTKNGDAPRDFPRIAP
jgi:hypothetical protein